MGNSLGGWTPTASALTEFGASGEPDKQALRGCKRWKGHGGPASRTSRRPHVRMDGVGMQLPRKVGENVSGAAAPSPA